MRSKIEPQTFKAQIVAFQHPDRNEPVTLYGVQQILESGEYNAELIMPIVDSMPTIIIKPYKQLYYYGGKEARPLTRKEHKKLEEQLIGVPVRASLTPNVKKEK